MSELEIILHTINIINFVQNELLLSSSSSSDDEYEFFFKKRKRTDRKKNFISDTIEHYSENEFKQNLGVSRVTANYLIEAFSNSSWYTKRTYQGGRSQLPASHHILTFLWFCRNNNSMRETSSIFHVTRSLFYKIFQNVLNFLTKDLSPIIIKFPTDEPSRQTVANEFEKISGFPNVLGCIDAIYISMRIPKHKIRSKKFIRDDMITVQGICDSKKRFLDVYTGIPGKINDFKVFNISSISKFIPSICESKYHLLGDKAYSIREYLLTPYLANLENSQKEFNLRFSQTRVKIKNAFELLKTRFPRIKRLDFHEIETMSKFILACCTLHNLCIDRSDIWDMSDTENIPNDEKIFDIHDSDDDNKNLLSKKLGEDKRKMLTYYFLKLKIK